MRARKLFNHINTCRKRDGNIKAAEGSWEHTLHCMRNIVLECRRWPIEDLVMSSEEQWQLRAMVGSEPAYWRDIGEVPGILVRVSGEASHIPSPGRLALGHQSEAVGRT